MDSTGATALILASKGGKLAAVQLLIERGANVHAKDKRGKTAEDWARENGQQKVSELFAKNV